MLSGTLQSAHFTLQIGHIPHHHHHPQINSSLQCTNANLIARFSSVILSPVSLVGRHGIAFRLFAPLYPGVSTPPVTVKPRSVIWMQYRGLLARHDDRDITMVSRLYGAVPCLAATAILARVTLLTRCRKTCHWAAATETALLETATRGKQANRNCALDNCPFFIRTKHAH